MANPLRLKKGLAANLPTLAAGEPAFTTDTKKLYIGDGTSNTEIGSVAGTDAITTAGTALSKSAQTLNHQNYGTAGTYAKVTTNAQGHVTAGAALAATDIPSLDWSKITSGKPATLAGYGAGANIVQPGLYANNATTLQNPNSGVTANNIFANPPLGQMGSVSKYYYEYSSDRPAGTGATNKTPISSASAEAWHIVTYADVPNRALQMATEVFTTGGNQGRTFLRARHVDNADYSVWNAWQELWMTPATSSKPISSGTWTPIIAGATTAGTYTISSFAGYQKINNMVYIRVEIGVTAIPTAGTGYFIISGIPFAPNRNWIDALSIGTSQQINFTTTNGATLCPYFDNNRIFIHIETSNTNSGVLPITSVKVGSLIRFSGWYMINT
jgi:hypothetical protein